MTGDADPGGRPPGARRWTVRGAYTVAAWLAAVVLLRLGGMDVRVELVAALVAVIALCSFVALELEARVLPTEWELVSRGSARTRGDDHRMRRYHRQLRDHVDGRRSMGSVHPALVELIEDRALARHGVDRSTDPERFEQLVGPELAAFVTASPHAVRLRSRGAVTRLVDRIESL